MLISVTWMVLPAIALDFELELVRQLGWSRACSAVPAFELKMFWMPGVFRLTDCEARIESGACLLDIQK